MNDSKMKNLLSIVKLQTLGEQSVVALRDAVSLYVPEECNRYKNDL